MVLDREELERRLERKLDALRARHEVPAGLLELVAGVLRAQMRAAARARVTSPGAMELAGADQRALGAPLLPREAFPLDMECAVGLFGDVLAMAAALPGLREPVRAVRQALDCGELQPADVIARHMAGDEAFFAAFARRTPDAPRFLAFLAQASLAPAMQAQAQAMDQPSPERVWPHGHCPVCGSLPYISVLEEQEGRRMLCCSCCQTRYRAPRLACPFCGENDPDRLEVLHSEQEPGFRLDACRSCGNYLKTVDFRNFDRVSLPALDDLESLTLDCLAQERGLTRPTLSAFGF